MELLKRRIEPPAVGAHDHVIGTVDASITLTEYGDYACAFCTRSYSLVERIRQDLGDELRFVYRHFPVVSPSRSRRAAQAAEAAASQGRFWEMHHLLSREPGSQLTEERLMDLAKSIGMNVTELAMDLRQDSHSTLIETSLDGGRNAGVSRTPTFFVNGDLYDGPLRADSLSGRFLTAAKQ